MEKEYKKDYTKDMDEIKFESHAERQQCVLLFLSFASCPVLTVLVLCVFSHCTGSFATKRSMQVTVASGLLRHSIIANNSTMSILVSSCVVLIVFITFYL
jgi:hypothetical protein